MAGESIAQLIERVECIGRLASGCRADRRKPNSVERYANFIDEQVKHLRSELAAALSVAPLKDEKEAPAMQGFDCTACGHRHSGAKLAYICIGCPCPEGPPVSTLPSPAAAPPQQEGEDLLSVLTQEPVPVCVSVVMASYDYEGSEMIRAFTAREEAEAFAEACRAYQATMPRIPDVEDDAPGSDAMWEAYDAAIVAWRVAHPAGDEYSADSYHVAELPLGIPLPAPPTEAQA